MSEPVLEFNRTETVFISIGSNTDDSRERVNGALVLLRALGSDIQVSETYTTRCWGHNGPDYLNCVVRLSSKLTLETLISECKRIEEVLGRKPGDKAAGLVPIDVDVVIFGNLIVRERDFSRDYFRIGYCMLANPRSIRIDDYTYDLPEDRIARHPLLQRDACRLLVSDRKSIISDTVFNRIGNFLPLDTFLIYNNTRVINARIRFVKSTGSVIEIFCLEPVNPIDYQQNFACCGAVQWRCMVGNSKRWKNGDLCMEIPLGDKSVSFVARRIGYEGKDSIVEFEWNDPSLSFAHLISAVGCIPIPPYLNRETEASDAEDYQTVYSRVDGSVAAPTAGLHFTDSLLNDLQTSGMALRNVTLHVGAGTFQPVKSDTMGDHDMHAELIDVPRQLILELGETQRPVTAVGTTSVRTLESLYHIGCMMHCGHWEGHLDQWYPYEVDLPCLSVNEAMSAILNYLDSTDSERLIARTRIIIAPGYRFRMVENLITNFHQPDSTLLLLIAAIVGDNWRDIYRYALDNGYRFLSYGDACLFRGLKTV